MRSAVRDKVVLITGATRGMGKAIAQLFAEEGAQLAINSRSEHQLQAMSQELSASLHRPLPVVGDIAEEEAARSIFDRCASNFGRIDTVVHCAGISRRLATIGNMDIEDYDELMRINARGTYLICREAARVMLKQERIETFRGQIVAFSSWMGIVGSPTVSAYNASKHAVMGMCRAAAKELQPEGIRVTVICPREVDTPQRREVVPPDSDDSRWMLPEEIAEQTLFVVSRPFWAGIQELVIGLPQNL